MEKIFEIKKIDLDTSKYDLVIGRGLCAGIGDKLSLLTNNKNVLIVYDAFLDVKVNKDIVSPLSDAGFKVFPHGIEGGKYNKNISELLKIYGTLEVNDFSRDSTLIAIGGGVIGDMGGFAASTYLRGMNLVHVPTTLMGMIDSSIGGKVAINFRKTINAIGNYYHPILNIMDIDWLDGLPQRDLNAGLAEAIKCGLIADPELFNFLNKNSASILSRSEEDLIRLISRSIDIKIDFVSGDIREGGKRLILNYGHTLGHSIEISTENDAEEVFRHGEGVSLGMIAAAGIAEKFLGNDKGIAEKHKEILLKYYLPVEVRSSIIGYKRDSLLNDCLRNVKKDKKRMDNKIRLILPERIGKCAVYNDVPFELIEESFKSIIKE